MEEIHVKKHKKCKKNQKYNISVNSRHSFELKGSNLVVSARSNDGVIEAIEDTNKRFFLGVQWHPERLWDQDATAMHAKLFKAFVDACKTA